MNYGQFIAGLCEAQGVEPDRRPSRVAQYMPDTRPYLSPLGTGEVSSRSQRREELKRHGCREVDPSELGSFSRRERERRDADFLPGEVKRSKPYAR